MENIEDFLKAVGALYDETRVKILKFIDKYHSARVCDLQASFGMIQSRLSRHLKILKEAGFLKVNREGRWAYYEIKKPMDSFRVEILKKIRNLSIDIPEFKKSDKCSIG